MKRKFLTLIITIFIGFIELHAQFAVQWENTLSGQGDFGDRFNSVVTDANNNIYVTGYSVNPNSDRDIIVAKYNSSLQLQWRKIFLGTGNGPDEGKKLRCTPTAIFW